MSHPRKLLTITIETKDDGALFWRVDKCIAGDVEVQGGAIPLFELGKLGIMVTTSFVAVGRFEADFSSPAGQRVVIDESEGAPLEAPVLKLEGADEDVDPEADTVVDGDAVPRDLHCTKCGLSLQVCACGLVH